MLFRVRLIVLGLLAIAFLLPDFAFARIGVGVGLGEIRIDEPIKPGGIYELPTLPVINTGTEPAEYEVGIEYHHLQPELLPLRDWFVFEPDGFHLEPGELKQVKISLVMPIRTEPGDYFAYVEGRSTGRDGPAGGTSIGVAAAAKLYFTIVPANVFEGIRFRAIALYEKYSPWPQVIFAIVITTILLFIFRRFFSLNLQVGRAKKK